MYGRDRRRQPQKAVSADIIQDKFKGGVEPVPESMKFQYIHYFMVTYVCTYTTIY